MLLVASNGSERARATARPSYFMNFRQTALKPTYSCNGSLVSPVLYEYSFQLKAVLVPGPVQ